MKKLENVLVQASENNKGQRVSSAFAYDDAMMKIFPWFASVSNETAELLTDTLSMGDDSFGGETVHVSFASVVNFSGWNAPNKIVWMSNAALDLVRKEHDDFDLHLHVEEVAN